MPHSQGSLGGFNCHSPVVWGEGSVGGDQGPRVQGLVGKREGFLSRRGGPGWSPAGQSPWGGPGQWMLRLGPDQAVLMTGRSGGRCRADPSPSPRLTPEPLCGGSWLALPEGSEARPVCVSLAPTQTPVTPPLSFPPRRVKAEQAGPARALSALTWAPHPLAPRPSSPCPVPGSQPSATPGSQAQPRPGCFGKMLGGGRMCGLRVPSELAPRSLDKQQRVCRPQGPVFSVQARRSRQPACGGRAGGRRTSRPAAQGERHGQAG